jgi:hypothetical protein
MQDDSGGLPDSLRTGSKPEMILVVTHGNNDFADCRRNDHCGGSSF